MAHAHKQHRFLTEFSDDALHQVQSEGLCWTVRHAYNGNARYREKFDALGLKPEDIRGLEDLHRLPFTSVADLREDYPLPLLSVPEQDVVRIHASSGTTGKRKILAYSQKDLDTFALQMARCYEIAGLTTMDRIQIAVGYGLWTAGAGFQAGSELFGAMTIPIGPGNLGIHLQMLEDMGTTVLGCTASMALLMGEEIERNGLLKKLKLRRMIFGAEAHSAKMRKTFEEKLGLEHSFDIAGMTEMYGPGTGLECEAHEGTHYWPDLFIIEILDPETLEPVRMGEVGEMVVTSLRKEAVPLIRYRTRDLTRMIPGACSCGLQIPRHDKILGRSDDMIIFRGVNIYPGQIADALHGFAEIGAEYHIELTRSNGRDSMKLSVERTPNATIADVESLAIAISNAIQRKIMARAEVAVVKPGELPRSFGKSKRVTDLRFI